VFSPLEQFDAIRLITLTSYVSLDPFIVYDVSFFNIIVPLLIILIIMFKSIYMLMDSYKLIPNIFQYVYESVITFVIGLIGEQIGKEGYIYFPFIFVLFNFILFSNLLSLVPFGIAITSHIILIMWLSLSICLSIFITGLYIHNIQFLKIFIPECPFVLLPLIILIEIFSYIIRAFSLAIRLSANIMAGHTLVFIISSFILNVTKIKFWFFFISFIILLAVLFLELGVAFLQAYVFSVLVCIYLNDAIKGPSH